MVKIEQTGGRLTEEEILHGKEDAYGIYQINRKGAGRDYAFLSFDSLRSKGKVPERTEYQLVYSDILGADENRDSLFTKFNIAHPDDFTGHSLSVSDIILIKRNGKVNVSYVDMIGFVPLPDFYKEPSLRVVEQITESTKGFTAEGHFGTWHSIQMQEFHNEKFFQMRHDEFGEQVADIIVNEQGQVIAEDLWHGFSPEAMKLIGEYLLSKSLYQKKEVAYLLPDNGYFMINFHTANLRPTKSLGVREPRVWLSETKRKTPECSGVSFFRAGNSNSLTNAFHICVYVHLCVVPRYIASQHPWKQSQSLLQNTKETTAGHFRRSVFLLSGRIPGVHELLWKAASLSCGRYR